MEANKINTQEVTKGLHKVYFGDKHLGEFVLDVDGYFYYWPTDERGCWASYSMRWIADKLDELNRPWDEFIQQNLSVPIRAPRNAKPTGRE